MHSKNKTIFSNEAAIDREFDHKMLMQQQSVKPKPIAFNERAATHSIDSMKRRKAMAQEAQRSLDKQRREREQAELDAISMKHLVWSFTRTACVFIAALIVLFTIVSFWR